MIRKRLLCFGLAAVIATSPSLPAFAAVNTSLSSTSMENCGAYLFEWTAETGITLRFWWVEIP